MLVHPQSPSPSNPKTPTTPSVKPKGADWCMPKSGVSDAQLQASLDYACGQGIDCSPIQPGGACFEPNTLACHAAYAMNLYYQNSEKNPWNCDFSQTAALTSKNPSNLSLTSALFLVYATLTMKQWPYTFRDYTCAHLAG